MLKHISSASITLNWVVPAIYVLPSQHKHLNLMLNMFKFNIITSKKYLCHTVMIIKASALSRLSWTLKQGTRILD